MKHPKLQTIILFADGLPIGMRWVNDKIQLQASESVTCLVKNPSQGLRKAEINRPMYFS